MRKLPLLLVPALLALAPAARADDDGSELPSNAALGLPQGGCKAPADTKPELAAAYLQACGFFRSLAARDANGVQAAVRGPFWFEGKQVASGEDVHKKWAQLLRDLRGTTATLYGFELMTAEDMAKKYGKPPAKLESWPLKGALVAVANVDGRAQVAALRKDNAGWAVFAFHD